MTIPIVCAIVRSNKLIYKYLVQCLGDSKAKAILVTHVIFEIGGLRDKVEELKGLYHEELFYKEARFGPKGRRGSARRVFSYPIATVMNFNKFCGFT